MLKKNQFLSFFHFYFSPKMAGLNRWSLRNKRSFFPWKSQMGFSKKNVFSLSQMLLVTQVAGRSLSK